MSLTIADGHQVSLDLRLTLEGGEVFHDTEGQGPVVFIQGQGTFPAGLERELSGLRAGDERDVTLSPADGFGEFDPALELTVGRDRFPADVELEAGMTFGAEGPGGVDQVWIKSVAGDEVVVTRNHPLAGQRLRFEVRVVDVQEAAQESAEPPST